MPHTDRAARVLAAPPDAVFTALVDPEALAAWLAPDGMTARFEHADIRPGGSYRLVLTYDDPSTAAGKATPDADVVDARILDVVAGDRVVQAVDFVSDDPAFAGTMTMTWRVVAVADGTRVEITADDVPDGIASEDHATGMASSLANLAAHVEGRGSPHAVVSWATFEEAAPDLAARVRALLDAGRHKTIATLRADGSPRISGIECEIAEGELRFGSMTGARKSADLLRDPRFALHGPTFHPVEGDEAAWPGEAKVAGRAVLVAPDGAAPADGGSQDAGDAFVADITEVVVTGLDPAATKLVIQAWTPTRGAWTVERE